MAERKTQENKASVKKFLNSIENETRRKDCLVVLNIMEAVSGMKAKMWGPSIVGCDKHYYKYANGSDGEICRIGFSPRARALVFYLANFKGKDTLLKKLGKHKISGSNGGGCLYINKLKDVNITILEKIIAKAYQQKGKQA